MTAEIVLMNKSAVALAADSAVTIETGTGLKIFRTVNKLFSLSKYHPVGVTIFGGAALNGLPWETVIKCYRQELGEKEFATVREYSENFFEYLDRASDMFPAHQQERTFRSTLVNEVVGIWKEIDEQVRKGFESQGQLSEGEVKAIVSSVIKARHDAWRAADSLPSLPPGYADSVRDAYRDTMRQIVASELQNLPLTSADRRRLLDLPALCATKGRFGDSTSGVVMAGFGRDELMPSLIGYLVDYVVENRVKRQPGITQEITHENSASVIPLAQSEMVVNFMEGINPDLGLFIQTFVNEIFGKMSDLVVELARRSGLSGSLDALKADLQTLVGIARKDFDDLVGERRARHVQPIMDTVAVLPKDELAAMAEAMVNLTSFKRKVSMDEVETVGGDIDVAVISKGDGFVWIKRKHYFDLDRNPLWLQNYYK